MSQNSCFQAFSLQTAFAQAGCTFVSVDMDDPDLYYTVRTDVTEGTASRFHPKVGKTLTESKWKSAFDKNGRLDISKVLIRIQRGGVHPTIRGEVWEFLLGCFDANSTYADREALRKSRRAKYSQLKAECRKMDSAVGSGVVVTLPRVNEDGSVVDNQQTKESNGNEPSARINVRDGLNRGRVPRSLLSFLQQDEDWRAVNSPRQISTVSEENTRHVEDRRVPQLRRSLPVKIGQTSAFQESQRNSDFRPTSFQDEERAVPGKSSHEQEVTQWRLTLHQVGLDVVRTDRTLQFYENPSNLAKLWDILAVYSWKDPDVGYCQGMSDLCSPMVMLYQNEADAFWCFERLMSRLRENFRCTDQAVGVQKQLENLGLILRVVDPKLHKHLDDLGGGSYIFAFRMLMVLFRREFSFGDSLYLWEIMWALEYDPSSKLPESSLQPLKTVEVLKQELRSSWVVKRGKSIYKWGKFEQQNIKYANRISHEIPFVVFCAASIFESRRLQLQEAPGLDEVVKILNDITGQLDAKKACKEALKIHKKYLLKASKLE